MKELLKRRADENGYNLTEEQLEMFFQYRNYLLEGNEKMNLTAIVDDEGMVVKHFIDSLTPWTAATAKAGMKVLDLGSGAGFPGIPMKIRERNIYLTMMDSLQKRVRFLEETVKRLGLKDTVAIHGRAEEMGRNTKYREKYDLVVSRAVAPFATLCEYCLPFVRVGGFFLAMKGPDGREEVRTSPNAVKILGGEIVEERSILLHGDENYERLLILVKKARPTPKKYPRGGGKPRKSPIV